MGLQSKYRCGGIFVRYEPNVMDGTCFIFNKESGDMLEGNYSAYVVIKSFDHPKTLDEAIQTVIDLYPEEDSTQIVLLFKDVFEALLDGGFVQEVSP